MSTTAAPPATCGEFLAPFLAGLEPGAALHLDLAGTRIAIRANEPGLLAALAEAYWDFPADDGPADLNVSVIEVEAELPDWPLPDTPGAGVTAKECWIDLPDGRLVRKRRTGIRVVFGPSGAAVIGPCRRHLDQVVNAVNCRFMERRIEAGAVLLHAAAVAEGSRGLAIAGLAGAGKSTLALELTSRGAAFVTNDRLLAAPGASGPVMTGQPRTPRVNPGTLLRNARLADLLSEEDRLALSALPEAALRGLEHKRDVPIHRLFGPGRFRLRADLAALMVLAWRPGVGPMTAVRTRLADRPDLVGVVQKDLGPLVRQGPRPASPADILAVLGAVPVLLLAGGVDFDRAAGLGQAILAGAELSSGEVAS